MAGPRSDPPIPMLTTAAIRLPVAPVQDPLRMRSERSPIFFSTAWTSPVTFCPSTSKREPGGMRSATCNTARSSVVLMCTPANMASRCSSTLAARARSKSRRSVSFVARCLE